MTMSATTAKVTIICDHENEVYGDYHTFHDEVAKATILCSDLLLLATRCLK